MYTINLSEIENTYYVIDSSTNGLIPLDPANRHYQKILDDIIEQGADCFEGDIPEDLQEAPDLLALHQRQTEGLFMSRLSAPLQ